MKKYIALVLTVILLLALVCSFSATAADKGTNLALNARTWSSSYFSQGMVSDRITDGSYQTIWAQGEFPDDGGIGGGYEGVKLDLGDNYWIYNIDIIGRPYDNETYKNVIVEISADQAFTNPVEVAVIDLQPNNYRHSILVDNDNGFRYVRAKHRGHFALAEIEVYGEKFDPTRKFVRDFEDTLNTKFDGPARVMDTLGILPKSGNYEYGSYYVLNRADALRSVLRLAKIEVQQPPYSKIFEDVDVNHPIAPYLYPACNLGIISADTYFRPDDYVTVQEYAKMILYALEYGIRVESAGAYPVGVLKVSNDLRLLSSIDLERTDYLNKENAAMILYNALRLSKFMEEEAILSRIHNVQLVDGILDGNAVTTLLSDVTDAVNSVQISGVRYTDESGFAAQLIGKHVTALLDEENNIQNIWRTENRNHVCEIPAEELQIDGNRVNHVNLETDKIIESYYLAEKPDVLKNGVVYPGWTMDSFCIPYGHLELIDNNGDNKIDVVNIWEPFVAVLNSIEKLSNGNILLQSVDGNRYLFSEPVLERILKNNRITTYGRLEAGTLVLAYASENGNNLVVNVTDAKKITAKASAVCNDEITLNGVGYQLSAYCKHNFTLNQDKLMKKTADYYLDRYGDILMIIFEDGLNEGESIGFIHSIGSKQALDAPLRFRIFTQEGVFIEAQAATKMTVDGVKKDASEYTSDMAAARTYFNGKFTLFTLDSQGCIKSLDTEHYNPSVESGSRMQMNFRMVGTDGVFAPPSNAFFNGAKMLIPCKRKTIAFSIPASGEGNHALDESYDHYYRVTDAETLFPTLSRMTSGAYAKFYGQDENRQPMFVAQFKPFSSVGAGGASDFLTSYSAPGLLVTKVSTTVDAEGNATRKITGYQMNRKGAETSIILDSSLLKFYDTFKIQQEKSGWLTDHRLIDSAKVNATELGAYIGDISNLKEGDIIRYQTGSNGVSILERVFSVDAAAGFQFDRDIFYSTGGSYPTYPSADFMLLFGESPLLHDEYITLMNNSNEHTFDYSQMDQVFVRENGKLKKISSAQLGAYVKSTSKVLFMIQSYQYITMFVLN